MLLGHYGLALAAKRAAPDTSLGTLFLAAQWCDEIWPLLLLLGLEHVRIVPGLMPANPLDFTSYPISHSLLLVLGWGAVFGLIYSVWRRYRVGAWVLAGLVVSHWLLDLVVHRADLPLWPGSTVRLGAGLWNSIIGTVVVELAILTFGVGSYVRTTRARDRIGTWGLAAMLVLLLAVFLGGVVGPPPSDERTLAISALGLWLLVPWGYWIDRHRNLRPSQQGGPAVGQASAGMAGASSEVADGS